MGKDPGSLDHATPEPGWPAAEGAAAAELHPEVHLHWRTLPIVPRSAAWPMAVAALIGLGLLITFGQVVREISKQGELRRQATALHAETTLIAQEAAQPARVVQVSRYPWPWCHSCCSRP